MKKLTRFIDDKTAILLTTTVNRRYFSGFDSSDGFLIITNRDATLFVDGRYYEAARVKAAEYGVELLLDFSAQLEKHIRLLGVERVVVENQITVALFEKIKRILPFCEVVPDDKTNRTISDLRSVKNDCELEKLRTAQKIADTAFLEILNYIGVGVSESSIATELEYLMKKNGAQEISFKTIAISGKNTSMPHGVPGNATVKCGDFVTMDFGAVYDGYHSDMTRTVAVGCVSDRMAEVYNTVLTAQMKAVDAVRAGVAAACVDAVARSTIEASGYGDNFTHSTGHGVGLEIHEYPNISSTNNDKLQVGNVITIEPGIYIESDFGVRIEDMLFVTESGCECITKADKRLIII